jgi:hypothetical protein
MQQPIFFLFAKTYKFFWSLEQESKLQRGIVAPQMNSIAAQSTHTKNGK